ncbi:hypothetical protein BCD48_31960 [Pseudofrankia sp. BMG5.36]|nr:hypothetical protein BCD48_31960 [Pseudofrankia sp. BMG5.36]
MVTAVGAGLLADWFFTPPVHSLFVRGPLNVVALTVFLVVALAVSGVVEASARYVGEAARARAEAAMLTTLSGSLIAGQVALPVLLDRVRESFAVESVTLLQRGETGVAPSRDTWALVGFRGFPPCLDPDDADTVVPISRDLTLALRGRVLPASDRSVLAAFRRAGRRRARAPQALDEGGGGGRRRGHRPHPHGAAHICRPDHPGGNPSRTGTADHALPAFLPPRPRR